MLLVADCPEYEAKYFLLGHQRHAANEVEILAEKKVAQAQRCDAIHNPFPNLSVRNPLRIHR
jgi:hypothetical protein